MSGDMTFPEPRVESPDLGRRLREGREHLIALHQSMIAGPIDERRQLLQRDLSGLKSDVDRAMAELRAILERPQTREQPEGAVRAVRTLHTQSRRAMRDHVKLWESLAPLDFDPDAADALIVEVQRFEVFDNQYNVPMEDDLYDPSTATKPYIRLLRHMRRFGRAISGTGRRTIPLGRLWRFYVELSVPRFLALAAPASAEKHEIFWYELGRYMRRFDALFGGVIEQLETPAVEPPTLGDETLGDEPLSADHEHDAHHGEPEEPAHQDPFSLGAITIALDPSQPAATRALIFTEQASEALSENVTGVMERLDDWLQMASRAYSWSLQQTYTEFLEAASKAGTLELPSFAYRPSKRYDRARRAETQLRQRLEREGRVVSGYIGWIVVEHQLVLFLAWFDHYQRRVADALHALFLDQCHRQLERLEERVERGIESFALHEPDAEVAPDWEEWLQSELKPLVRASRRALERGLVAFGQGVTSRRLIDALEYRVAGFSERIDLLERDPDITPPTAGNLEATSVRVRQWFSNRLVSEIALRYIEFNERAERLARRTIVGLDSLSQILEYNLGTVQQDIDEPQMSFVTEVIREADIEGTEGDNVALSALQRTDHLVAQMRNHLVDDVAEIEAWIVSETSLLRDRTCAPLIEYRVADMQRRLQRHSTEAERVRNMRGTLLASVRSRGRVIQRAIAPLYEEVLEDVRHLLRDEPRPAPRSRIRERLEIEPPQSLQSLPPIYRRLFNPVPLDLPEFYVERPEKESLCLNAIAQWGRGTRTSILVHGDRGIGKRTFIHNLVPIRIYDLAPVFQTIPIQTIRLSEDVHTEREMCAQFATLFEGSQPPRTFDEMARYIDAWDKRQIIVVENANKIYTRTPEGMERCRDFLELIDRTCSQTLWIVVLDTPAATLLDTMIDLFDYFSHTFELGPLDAERIERLILNRHRVSGFEVSYAQPSLRLLYRTRHPLEASDALRHPRRDFFRHLGIKSHGSPLLAMLYWMRSIHPDRSNETHLHVEPLRRHDGELLTDGLTLKKQLILALLLQHGSLSVEMLADMLDDPRHDVATQIAHLARLGFVERLMGSAQYYHLRALAAVEVTIELRQLNLV